MRVILAIPLILLLALGACKKPLFEVHQNFIPPLVLSTPIQDSLPSKAVRVLRLDNVSGLKIKHSTGLYASYFEYEADRHLLLETISALPFSINATIADSLCHPISFRDIEVLRQNLPLLNLKTPHFFGMWIEARWKFSNVLNLLSGIPSRSLKILTAFFIGLNF